MMYIKNILQQAYIQSKTNIQKEFLKFIKCISYAKIKLHDRQYGAVKGKGRATIIIIKKNLLET